jgi:glyoxylase-like metal-dependent hydrolase (beta-lactamase superfamily II)
MADNYTGQVTAGGPPDIRDTGPLTITKLSVGPMDNNADFLRCASTGEVLLIDAANEPDRLADLVGADDGRPELNHLVTTHRHQDHWQALGAVAGMFQTRQIAHPLDAPELPIPMDELVEHGDTVRFGEIELEVIHLRGHTPGSIALVYRGDERPHIFTGDSLFPGGVGKTGSPEDFASLVDDVEQRVFAELPDETWVYPGHGDDTTLAVDRGNIPEWRSRGW